MKISESKRVQIKEALAKLMATENIVVEHAPVPTAAFDLENRKLIIPNWKNISEDVYTLLISHEVGHALYTPEKEWKESSEKEGKSFRNVMNIVEDVRIEKNIQQKYPGTVRSFRSGYGELDKANLFGTQDKDISEYGILDRINIHFKVGHFGYQKVPFASKEQKYVKAVSACKTFDDVLKVARELLKYAKEEAKEKGQELNTEVPSTGNITIEADSKETADRVKEEIEKQSGKQSGEEQGGGNKVTIKYPKDGEEKDGEQGEEGSGSSKDGEEDKEAQGKSSEAGNGQEGNSDEIIVSVTQDTFERKIERNFIDLKSSVKYLNVPKYDLSEVIVPYKRIIENFRNHYSAKSVQIAKAKEDLGLFKHNNKHIVNQLVNLFEMKKRAKADARALTSKTGHLDTNKVHSYRYNEDIFKKITLVPNGKNHGLVMIVDMSGSMAGSMPGSISQIINLVMFCKKVNIPFEVFGFSDVVASKKNIGRGVQAVSSGRTDDIILPSNFSLRNYFSSKMSGAEYNEMLVYMICLMSYYSTNRSDYYSSIPQEDGLGCTPLDEAILCLTQFVPEFKESYNLDIVNTILLTDGDGTSNFKYVGGEIDRYKVDNLFFRHFSSKKIWNILGGTGKGRYTYRDLTDNLLQMYRDITGTKMIGFYISNSGEYHINSSCHNSKEREEKRKCWQDKRFVEITSDGYDAYYIVPQGDELMTKGEDLGLGGKQSRTIQRSFNRAMKQKRSSRILLNRFIEHIA